MYQDTDNSTALEAALTTNASTIRAEAQIFTLINVFSVARDRQQEIADLLIEATERTMRHRPGFISANIHTSFDGRRVVNYAQWRSRDAALASFDPILCEVAHVDHA
jgi:Antibiotic biosynthesis monooxygenase